MEGGNEPLSSLSYVAFWDTFEDARYSIEKTIFVDFPQNKLFRADMTLILLKSTYCESENGPRKNSVRQIQSLWNL